MMHSLVLCSWLGSALFAGTCTLCASAALAQTRVADVETTASASKRAVENVASAEAASRSDADEANGGAAEANDAAAKAVRRERRHERRAAAEAAGDKPERKSERAKTEPSKHHVGTKRRDRQPNAEYRRLRDQWHQPVVESISAEPIVDPTEHLPLVISPVNGGTLVSALPAREDGGFSTEDLEQISRAFAPKDMHRTHPIAPHLVDLVYRTMRHFKAPLVHLVSGYRADRAGSRHTQGRAIDMVIPGISNEDLAAYVRKFGFCGVGIYPKSGFVHLDVRESSYFWVDYSLPDERSRSEPILGTEAQAADREARARGEGPDSFVPDNDREDHAAARSYAKRAQRRRAAAARAAARAEQ